MKTNLTIQRLALLTSAILIPAATALGAIAYGPGYLGVPAHIHQGGGTITSFDRGADGHLYYQTESNWNFGGFHRWDGATQTTLVNGNADFPGGSVVAIGDFVYYNTNNFTDQNIYRYGALSSSTPTNQLTSTTVNWGLYTHGGDLFITGAEGFGTNHIYHSTLNAAGELNASPATDLGVTFGSSGPLAFDAAGNLYYAPGFGDLSIYRWSAGQVSAAIADPNANPLPLDGVLWADYSAVYGNVSGATGMTFDSDGNLAVTLTDFADPSYLVSFGFDENGEWNGGYTELLASTDPLGDLRNFDGSLYLASGDTILQIIPEPGTWSLLFGLAALGTICLRRSIRSTPRR